MDQAYRIGAYCFLWALIRATLSFKLSCIIVTPFHIFLNWERASWLRVETSMDIIQSRPPSGRLMDRMAIQSI